MKSAVTALIIATLVMGVCIGLLASAPTLPQVIGSPDVSLVEQISQRGIARLVLSNTDGNVTVTTYNGDEVSVTADIRAFAGDAKAVDQAEAYVKTVMQSTTEDGVMNVVTEADRRPAGLHLYVVYSVQVPRGTEVAITAENGNVTLGAGCGAITVKGHNTDIDIANPLDTVMAESVNGRITLSGAPAGGRLSTVNGNVQADIEGGFLEASTANGLIFANLLKPVIDGCRLTSQNGGIRLHVKDGSSASIDARTARGNIIVTDLDMSPASGTQRQRQLRGTIGQGSQRARLEMDALNGNIYIASTGT